MVPSYFIEKIGYFGLLAPIGTIEIEIKLQFLNNNLFRVAISNSTVVFRLPRHIHLGTKGRYLTLVPKNGHLCL